MAECDCSMLSEISKFEASSNQNHEKQTASVEVNEKVAVDEGSVINKQNENQTVGEEVNWEEYPPLQRRGSSANSVGRSTSGWVDARKKPHSSRPFDFRVNVEEKSDISTEESVVSSEGCSRVQDLLKKPADWRFDSAEESVASSEVCSSNGTSTKAHSRCFLVKVPRLEDELLKEQIRLAELHCDEKTSLRDAIRGQIETRIQVSEYDHALDDVKSARELVKLKRKEIDSHLSVIRVVRNALSFDDMDSQEAFEQQLKAEEYLKTLKKELESLKASVLRAETAAAVVQKKNHNEERKVKELEARFRVENAACQTAYAQLRSLRTQHREKMREFFGYRDEATAASKSAYSKNGDRLCKNQVERFMKMWNKNKEFRKDYVKSNGKSIVWRFGTLDGRSLGPDEKPVLLMMPRHVPVVNMVVQKEIDQQEMSEEDVTSDEVITRKAEEEMLMEQKLEAELKEQKIEVVEANEAQMGAEVKAQMEAEKREKKRHKRLRLKERKKAARVGPSEDVDQRGKDLDSEQSTSLKTTYDDDDHDHDHDHELNEQVLDDETSTELAPPEKDDVEVTMQQQTPQETETKEGSDEVDQVKDRREKKRQKRLRNKERKKASREVSSPSPSEVMNEESHEAKAADSNQEEEEEIKNEEEEEEREEEREDDEVIVIEQQQPPEALMAQIRAEIKAQLEAQLRDKNRDKNLRKKKRKNAPTTTTTTNGNGRRTFLWVFIIILIILILFHPIS